jgi:hypothetical protein
MPQTEFGKTEIWDDFLGPDNDLTWGTGTVQLGMFGFVSVNEGSFEWTVDEPGGIVAITTDSGNDDNAAIFAGTFQASNGDTVTEWRFKMSNVDCAIFVGFTETLALDTPVMPAEFATVSMTYNGSGNMVGFQYDVDGDTDDFRAIAADGGAVVAGADANGTRANETITADEWYICRVVLHEDGSAHCYIGHDGGLDGPMQLVGPSGGPIGTGLNTTDQLYGVLMIENRTANARTLEVDYGHAKSNRDWAVD